jgi:hypothetical protein
MSIVILNYTPYEDTPYDQWIPEIKDEIVIYCNDLVANTFPTNSNMEIFENYNDNGNIENKIIQLHSKKPIKRIIALDEYDKVRAARLRKYLNIHGQSVESALVYRDKLMMKRHLSSNGIIVPAFTELRSAIDLLDFIEKHDFPVVVKPRSLAGSIGVTVLNNKKELEKYLNDGIIKNSMVEEFILGNMFHVDGLVENNTIKFIWPSVYTTSCLDWKVGGYSASHMLSPDNPKYSPLIKYVSKIIKKMDSPDNFVFHAEVFDTKENGFIFNEIACRVPGGRSNYEFEYSCNINLNKTIVRIECGLKGEVNPQLDYLTGHIYCPPKEGKLVKLPEKIPFDCVVEYKKNSNVGDIFEKSKDASDKIATIIVKGDFEHEVKNNISKVYDWFVTNCTWTK